MLVFARLHVGHPVLVVEVPLHRLPDTSLKGFFRFPAEIITNLGGINRVASVVSRPIFNKGNLIFIRLAIVAFFSRPNRYRQDYFFA